MGDLGQNRHVCPSLVGEAGLESGGGVCGLGHAGTAGLLSSGSVLQFAFLILCHLHLGCKP